MPMLGALAIGAGSAAGGIIGSIISSNASQSEMQAALAAAQQAQQIIAAVGAPPNESAPIIIQQLRQAGVYNPQLEQQITLGVSQVSQIQSDQQSRQAQISALQQLQARSQGGLTPSDTAAFNQLRTQAQTDAQGKVQQIVQQYQAQGQGGSGGQLAAELSGAQNAAQMESAGGQQQAAAASQNALAALGQLGGLSTQVQGQQFQQAQTKAQAADLVNQFNTQQSIARQQQNVGASNQAQQENLANAQNISNANVQAANNELYRQAAAKQQYWQDQLQQAGMEAGALTGQVPIYEGMAQQAGQFGAGIGSAISQGISGAGTFYVGANQQPAQTNIYYPGSGGNQAGINTAQAQQLPAVEPAQSYGNVS